MPPVEACAPRPDSSTFMSPDDYRQPGQQLSAQVGPEAAAPDRAGLVSGVMVVRTRLGSDQVFEAMLPIGKIQLRCGLIKPATGERPLG